MEKVHSAKLNLDNTLLPVRKLLSKYSKKIRSMIKKTSRGLPEKLKF